MVNKRRKIRGGGREEEKQSDNLSKDPINLKSRFIFGRLTCMNESQVYSSC